MNARTVVADHPRPRSIGGSASRAMDLLRDLATDKPIRCSRQRRAALKQRLAQVEDLITLGRQQFARQLTIVTEIERNRGDSTAARETLHLFAQAHAIRLDDRDRIARLLEQA
jgi:hypothetical protein